MHVSVCTTPVSTSSVRRTSQSSEAICTPRLKCAANAGGVFLVVLVTFHQPPNTPPSLVVSPRRTGGTPAKCAMCSRRRTFGTPGDNLHMCTRTGCCVEQKLDFVSQGLSRQIFGGCQTVRGYNAVDLLQSRESSMGASSRDWTTSNAWSSSTGQSGLWSEKISG